MTEEEIQQLKADYEAAQKAKDALAAKNQQILDEKKKLAARFDGIDVDDLKAKAAIASQFEGHDVNKLIEKLKQEEAEQLSAEEDKIRAKHGIDGVLEHRMRNFAEQSKREKMALEAKVQEEAEKANSYLSMMRQKDLSLSVSSAVSRAGKFVEGADRYIAMDVQGLVRYDENGGLYLEKNGEKLTSKTDPMQLMTIEEFVATEIPELSPALLKQATGVGAKGSADVGSQNVFETGTAAEQAKFRNENPEKAKQLAKLARAKGIKPKISI